MSKAVKLDADKQFTLPAGVIGRSDISRLLREIEKVDYDLEAQTIRAPGQPVTIPAMSRGLAETMQVNNIAVEQLEQRQQMLAELRRIKEHAPMVQITFASDPAPEITIQLVSWIRQNLHPTALVTIGLQPSIVGGCVVRTPDHIYDFSLRNHFKKQLPELVKYLRNATLKAA